MARFRHDRAVLVACLVLTVVSHSVLLQAAEVCGRPPGNGRSATWPPTPTRPG
jgi:hypothetical protein